MTGRRCRVLTWRILFSLALCGLFAETLPAKQPQTEQPAGSVFGDISSFFQGVSGGLETEEGRRYLRSEFDYESVDLEELVKRLNWWGFELPVKLSGQVSIYLQTRVPLGSVRDVKTYRAEGSLRSSELTIDTITLREVKADLQYEDGSVRLEKLRFRLPQEDTPADEAVLEGSAQAELIPQKDLTVDFSLTQLPMERLLEVVPEIGEVLQGKVSGKFQGQVPVKNIADPEAWIAEGSLNFQSVQAYGWTLRQALAELDLREGTVQLEDFSGSLDQGKLAGKGSIQLIEPFAYDANLDFQQGDLAAFMGLPAEVRPPVDLFGDYAVTLDLSGNLAPLSYDLDGTVSLSQLQVAEVSVGGLDLEYALDQETLRFPEFQAQLFGGKLSGSAQIPLTDAAPGSISLQAQHLELGKLADQFLSPTTNWRGQLQATAEASFPPGKANDLSAWRFGLDLQEATLQVGDQTLTQASGTLQLENEEVAYDLSGEVFDSPWQFQGDISLEELAQLRQERRYLPLELDWDTIELDTFQQRLKVLGLGLPIELSGLASASVRLAIPINSLQDARLYRFIGRLDSSRLRLGPWRLSDLSLGLNYRNGVLDLQPFQLGLLGSEGSSAGSVDGSVKMELVPSGEAKVAIRLVELPFSSLVVFNPELNQALSGTLNGEMQGQVLIEAIADPSQWQGEGSVTVPSAAFRQWSGKQGQLDFDIQQGTLRLKTIQFDSLAGTVDGQGEVELNEPYPFSTELSLKNGDLAVLNEFPAELRSDLTLAGKMALDLDFAGKGTPFDLQGKGSGELTDFRINQLNLNRLDFLITADDRQLRLQELQAKLYGGQISGFATLPLSLDQAGQAELRWNEVEITQLVAAVGEFNNPLQGTVDGKINLEMTEVARPESWTGTASFETAEILAQSQSVAKFNGEATLETARLDYQLSGAVLEGQITAEGKLPFEPSLETQDEGKLHLQGIRFSALSALLPFPVGSEGWNATGELRAEYQHYPAEEVQASGQVQFSDLRWQQQLLSEQLQGSFQWSKQLIRVQEFGGRFSGGQLQTQGSLNLEVPQRSQIELSLRRVELNETLAPWEADDWIDGRMDLRLNGSGADRWSFRGSASLSRGTFQDIAFSTIRAPLRLYIEPLRGIARLNVSQFSGQLARGRIKGSLEATYLRGLNLKGSGKFVNLQIPELLKGADLAAGWGSGKAKGEFSVEGKNVQSLEDLSGTIQADFSDGRRISSPLLRAISPYLQRGRITSFDSGSLRASFAKSVLRVQSLTLSSRLFQIFAQGTVNLAGRLNLEVFVNTNFQVADANLLQLFARRIPAIGPIPVGLLVRANEWLQNRVITLSVTGTIEKPVVRVRPMRLLKDEIVRFFLRGLKSRGLPN